MKKLMFLLVLTMAPSLGGESVAFSNHATAASAPREEVSARPPYEYGTEHQINAFDEKNRSNEKSFRLARPTTETEAKRLKLMFLLMMSLGQYRTPVH